MTDDQVTALEKLETKQIETTEGAGKAAKLAAKILGVASVDEVEAMKKAEQSMAEFDVMAAELSETFGFDVLPIMNTIVGTTDRTHSDKLTDDVTIGPG